MERLRVIKWWKQLYYVNKWDLIVKYNELIFGYPDRNPDTLTGREIELIYTKEKGL